MKQRQVDLVKIRVKYHQVDLFQVYIGLKRKFHRCFQI
jgi:hypothetical protein